MEKKYCVSDRVIGIYFNNTTQIKRYLKRNVKHYYEGYNIGEVKTLSDQGLKEYAQDHKIRTVWRESTM